MREFYHEPPSIGRTAHDNLEASQLAELGDYSLGNFEFVTIELLLSLRFALVNDDYSELPIIGNY